MDEVEVEVLASQLMLLRYTICEDDDTNSVDSILYDRRLKTEKKAYRGVTRVSRGWQARIRWGRVYTIGFYKTEREAAMQYDQAMADLKGGWVEKCDLNFPRYLGYYSHRRSNSPRVIELLRKQFTKEKKLTNTFVTY